jgi:outer membrane protein assembly factor BamA
VPDGNYLLTENIILVDSTKIKESGVYSQLAQKPNPTIPLIGLPLGLHIYNLADPYPDSTYNKWLYKNPNREERLIKFLSKKQVNQIDSSYVGFNEWLQKLGDAPVIINDTKIEKSEERLKRWYASLGYFNNEVNHEVTPNEKRQKRAKLTYKVTRNKSYTVGDTILEKISSPVVDSLFQKTKASTFLIPGKQYAAADFVNERDRLTVLYRNSGLFYFEQDYVRFEADTVNTDHKANITYLISDRKVTEEDTTYTVPFKIHKINEVRIITDYSYANRDRTFSDSISFKGYKLLSYGKMRYRPKAITDAVSIIPGKIYKDIDRTLTYNQLSDLKIFKYPNINYTPVPNDSTNTLLNTTILLSPRDNKTLGVDFDAFLSTVQQYGIGFSGNLIFRNIFRGAEIFQISGKGSLGSSKDAADSSSSFFNISEFGGDAKLTFPRIIFPINTQKIIPKYMLPTTTLSIGASAQNNIGLDRQATSGFYNYSWKPSKILSYQLDLINLQYVKNLKIGNYFNVYKNSFDQLNDIAQQTEAQFPGSINPEYYNTDSNNSLELIIPEGANGFINDVLNRTIMPISDQEDAFQLVDNIEERKNRLTENNLIFATNITRTRDTRENIQDNSFSRTRFKLESAGNLLSSIADLAGANKNDRGNYEVLNVVYSQYIKGEAEYIKHWELNDNNILAFRAFGGIAIPYGNSNSIPFTRSYFAGGANDNRGWSAYDLGPGSSGSKDEFNEANFKLALNAEYRFTIIGAVKGALFVDSGNIWNVFDNIQDEQAVFNGIEDLKELAIASGFGLRYDFGFFVVRLDLGFKTHNPARLVGERWFKDYNFSNAVYNIGINYPF